MTTATMCNCCKSDMSEAGDFDKDLGVICEDCAKGVADGLEVFATNGVSGVYIGVCGDSGEKMP